MLRRRLAALGEGESDVRNVIHSFFKGVNSDDTWQRQVCHRERKPVADWRMARLIAQLIGQLESVFVAVLDQFAPPRTKVFHIDGAVGKAAALIKGLRQLCRYRKQYGLDVFDNALFLLRSRAGNTGRVAPSVLRGWFGAGLLKFVINKRVN